MKIKSIEIRIKEYFYILIILLIITDLSILLNIPFLRQIFGFLFLTILPGLLILQILKLNKICFLEKFILTWGLSISFLMFFGLLINNLLLCFGYETPLSTIPLLISFNIAFILLAVVVHKMNKDAVFSLPNFNLNASEKAFLIFPVIFPALSIFGMNIMNTTDNNIILMFLLFLIPIYVACVCLFNHKFPKRLYPGVIFLIGISLLLFMPLRTNHIIGIDTHVEYYYFRTILNNLHWGILGYYTFDACLSISLLPTLYQSILNISPVFLFKILYSLIYSISPLVIYVISKKYVGEPYGFLASIFFISQTNFLQTEVTARTNTAILFFALAMMTLFSDRIDPLKKRILFIVFMASCMVSHYSTTYIFFFVMLGSFFGMEMLSKKYTFKKIISLTMGILFFSMIFFWYSQVTETAFNAGISFIENTFGNLNTFFVEELREGGAEAMLGVGITQKGIPHKIQFVFTWLTFAFIGIGIIMLTRRYKEMSFPELNFKKPDFLKDKFEVEYFAIAFVCVGLLVAIVALPHIAAGYSLQRSYAAVLIILSVFFVIGGIILSKFMKIRACLIILLVLIPYFLCVTGAMYTIFGVPRVITLNSEGEKHDLLYVHDQDSYAAKWLSSHGQQNLKIHCDHAGLLRLASQGGISGSLIDCNSIFKHKKKLYDGYIYLRYYNVVSDKFLPAHGDAHNMTEYSDIFIRKSKIYNSSSVIFW